MADIEKVRPDDTLRVPVRVIFTEGKPYPRAPLVCRIEMPDGREGSLSRTDVEAAEHIPAPKVFKRGDFVRSLLSSADRGGLVVGQRDIKSEVWVTWPGNEQCQPVPLPSETLEHDEAPE